MNSFRFVFFTLLSCSLVSCAVKEGTSPAEPSGFLSEVDQAAIVEGQPWDHSWERSPDYSKYTAIFFEPVRFDFISEERKEQQIESSKLNEEQYAEKINALADYFDKRLEKSFKSTKKQRLELVGSINDTTMVVEIAMTEVVFHRPVAYAVAYAIPIPGSSYAFDGLISPRVAFELKVTDGDTGELICTMADRALPPVKPLDLNKFTVSRPLEEVIDIWVREFVRSADQVITEDLRRRLPVRLLPF
jgi:hypothetical protein